jgi:hypothetical protein
MVRAPWSRFQIASLGNFQPQAFAQALYTLGLEIAADERRPLSVVTARADPGVATHLAGEDGSGAILASTPNSALTRP